MELILLEQKVVISNSNQIQFNVYLKMWVILTILQKPI